MQDAVPESLHVVYARLEVSLMHEIIMQSETKSNLRRTQKQRSLHGSFRGGQDEGENKVFKGWFHAFYRAS